MAKEMKEEKEPKGEKREGEKKEEKSGKEKGRKHLHEIRSVQAEDGTIVHHHTFKKKKEDQFAEPERGPMATSSTPEEAGQHVAEQFGQNQMGGEEGAQGGGEPEAGAEPMPGA